MVFAFLFVNLEHDKNFDSIGMLEGGCQRTGTVYSPHLKMRKKSSFSSIRQSARIY